MGMTPTGIGCRFRWRFRIMLSQKAQKVVLGGAVLSAAAVAMTTRDGIAIGIAMALSVIALLALARDNK
jgi:hypothetical protein